MMDDCQVFFIPMQAHRQNNTSPKHLYCLMFEHPSRRFQNSELLNTTAVVWLFIGHPGFSCGLHTVAHLV